MEDAGVTTAVDLMKQRTQIHRKSGSSLPSPLIIPFEPPGIFLFKGHPERSHSKQPEMF